MQSEVEIVAAVDTDANAVDTRGPQRYTKRRDASQSAMNRVLTMDGVSVMMVADCFFLCVNFGMGAWEEFSVGNLFDGLTDWMRFVRNIQCGDF